VLFASKTIPSDRIHLLIQRFSSHIADKRLSYRHLSAFVKIPSLKQIFFIIAQKYVIKFKTALGKQQTLIWLISLSTIET